MENNPCTFCESDIAVLRNELAYACYDKYAVTPGHTLIVPFRHVADYFRLCRHWGQGTIDPNINIRSREY